MSSKRGRDNTSWRHDSQTKIIILIVSLRIGAQSGVSGTRGNHFRQLRLENLDDFGEFRTSGWIVIPTLLDQLRPIKRVIRLWQESNGRPIFFMCDLSEKWFLVVGRERQRKREGLRGKRKEGKVNASDVTHHVGIFHQLLDLKMRLLAFRQLVQTHPKTEHIDFVSVIIPWKKDFSQEGRRERSAQDMMDVMWRKKIFQVENLWMPLEQAKGYIQWLSSKVRHSFPVNTFDSIQSQQFSPKNINYEPDNIESISSQNEEIFFTKKEREKKQEEGRNTVKSSAMSTLLELRSRWMMFLLWR
jgi:hypothetical protein